MGSFLAFCPLINPNHIGIKITHWIGIQITKFIAVRVH